MLKDITDKIQQTPDSPQLFIGALLTVDKEDNWTLTMFNEAADAFTEVPLRDLYDILNTVGDQITERLNSHLPEH